MSSKCRSCEADVIWLEHERTGKPAPIDAKPTSDGNIVVDDVGGTYSVVPEQVRDNLIEAGMPLHTNHFATCPQRAAWRERAAKAGGS
jgi:hypothetical protein